MKQAIKIFLFNSSLPEGKKPQDVLHYMGNSNPKFRGQNIGNTYISYGFIKFIFGSPVEVDHLSNAWDSPLTDELAEKINSEYSHFVFILQDYIREDFDSLNNERFIKFLDKIDIPIVPISLCVNSLNGFDLQFAEKINPAQIRFLAKLSEKSKSIGVRGNYSAEVLKALGIKNVKVVGCPSYFENGPFRTLNKKEWSPEKVVTTATYFNNNLPNTPHILQDELYFINLLFLGGSALPDKSNITSRPYNIDEIPTSLQLLLKAMRGQLEFFSDLNQWRDFYKKNDYCLTVGTRLHSGIFSINSGVPAIVTNPDSRARETCEYLDIPYDTSIDTNSDIRKIYEELDLEKINKSYSQKYQIFFEYIQEHGLHAGEINIEKNLINFPQMSKRETSTVMPELYQAFTEFTKAIEREVITIETFGGEKVTRAKQFLRKLADKTPGLSAENYYRYLIQTFGKKIAS